MADPKFDEKFVDPGTGETVTRVKIKPELLVQIEKDVNLNANAANGFLQLSRQLIIIERQRDAQFDIATKAEQDIGKEVIRIREKMGLDSSWIFNIPMKMMEKREAPADSRVLSEGLDKK